MIAVTLSCVICFLLTAVLVYLTWYDEVVLIRVFVKVNNRRNLQCRQEVAY